jgi:hypothetical protein
VTPPQLPPARGRGVRGVVIHHINRRALVGALEMILPSQIAHPIGIIVRDDEMPGFFFID